LSQYREENKRKDVAIIRIEQLYPFPDLQLDDELEKYPDAEYVWVQEEPANMGYWWFVLSIYNKKLHVIARKRGSSPATGYHKQHEIEQKEIIETAFSI
jgi:2-oxoglutarate dehydrogenase E1 component